MAGIHGHAAMVGVTLIWWDSYWCGGGPGDLGGPAGLVGVLLSREVSCCTLCHLRTKCEMTAKIFVWFVFCLKSKALDSLL